MIKSMLLQKRKLAENITGLTALLLLLLPVVICLGIAFWTFTAWIVLNVFNVGDLIGIGDASTVQLIGVGIFMSILSGILSR